jgi:hypothetical protein
MSITQNLNTNKKQCPACQQLFSCDVIKGASCWCMNLPKLNAISDIKNTACLCPNCLALQTANHIKNLYKTEELNSLLEIARLNSNNNELIEHIDYTIENSYTVFTHWYHLKRGTCCSNGCKNCPFKAEAFMQFK